MDSTDLFLDRLDRALLGIAMLDEVLQEMKHGGGAPQGGGCAHQRPGSKPPVPLYLTDLTWDALDITRSWALNLHADNPGAWHPPIYPDAPAYARWLWNRRETVAGMDWADDCLDETEAMHQRMLDALPKQEPEPIREVPDQARDMLVTAREASRITGIKENTISQWGRRGTVSTTGKPRLYRIGDLLDHHNKCEEPHG